LAGDPVPVYGDGAQVRNWLYVDDCCAAVDLVLEHGEAGQVYNAGGPDELPNLEVVRRILELTRRDQSLIEHVADRPGHDRRYSLASDRLEGIGWKPEILFAEGITRTVEWYRRNEAWWGPLRSGEYRAYYERQYGKALN
jgi:dTDP-glucose 4,6-dehydratase